MEKDNNQLVMKTSMPISIKAYEIDAMGVVSNIVYVKWLEDARHVFLEKYFSYDKMIETGISPVMMKNEITYKKPLRITEQTHSDFMDSADDENAMGDLHGIHL